MSGFVASSFFDFFRGLRAFLAMSSPDREMAPVGLGRYSASGGPNVGRAGPGAQAPQIVGDTGRGTAFRAQRPREKEAVVR